MGFFNRAGAKKSGCKKRIGFTLTELLVVVIVLGVLAAVAAPKFTRVLETRKTTEAEDLLSAVRAEQEHRCLAGRNYTQSWRQLHASSNARESANFSFTLAQAGASASSKTKDYSLLVPSYKDGRICCEGAYCDKLNKDYPLCSSLPAVNDDMCAAPDADFCTQYPDDCSCNPDQAKCCASGTQWNGSACVPTQVCSNPVYAQAHPCECAPNSCACPAYAAAYPCECDEAAQNSCQCNPNQAVCCQEGQIWDGSRCVADVSGTCQDPAYAQAHPCECAPNTCQCPTYAAAYPCECARYTCACPTYAAAYPCECTPNSCACPTYAAGYPEQCGAGWWQWVKGGLISDNSSAPAGVPACSSLIGTACTRGAAPRSCYQSGQSYGPVEAQVSVSGEYLCSGAEDITSMYNCDYSGKYYYWFEDDTGRRYVNENCGQNSMGCHRVDQPYECPSGDNWTHLRSIPTQDPQTLCEQKCPADGACAYSFYYCDLAGKSPIGFAFSNGEDEKVYASNRILCYRSTYQGATYQAVCRQAQ